jgi:ketosteroid isomerase-like protein
MKTFTKSILIVLCITLFSSAQLLGQEWSAEQKEVWKNVETYWDLDSKEDLEGFMSYFHDDYSGWYNLNPLPGDKAKARKFITHGYKTTETMIHDIQPVAINIHGNVAIVQYYYSRVFKDAEGKEKNENGHWTDILMKQGDKWVMIGDSGGPSASN